MANTISLLTGETKRKKRLHSPHHENIVGLRDVATSRKQLHQVMELPVDVTTHRHGAVHRLNVRLFDEDLLHLDIQQNQYQLHRHNQYTQQRQPFPHIYLHPLRTLTPQGAAGSARAAARASNAVRKTLGAERASKRVENSRIRRGTGARARRGAAPP